MKTYRIMYLFFLGLLIITLPRIIKAGGDSSAVAFSMPTPIIAAGPNPQVGDIVQMTITFTAYLTDSVNLNLHFGGTIAPPNQIAGETERNFNINVQKDSTYTYVYPMKLWALGGSLLEVTLSAKNFHPDFGGSVGYGRVEIEHGPASFVILGPHTNNVGTLTPDAIALGGTEHLSISGKVVYNDVKQDNIIRGAYGVRVVLVFHRNDVVGAMALPCSRPLNLTLSHPINGCKKNVHYDSVHVNGDFSFNFDVPQGTLGQYNDCVILVTPWNDACFLKGDEVNTYTINGIGTCAWTTFRETYSQCIPIGNGTTNIGVPGIEIRLNEMDGPILRNAQFSQDFYRDRPVGATVPDQIRIYPDVGINNGTPTFNQGLGGTYITIHNEPASCYAVDHEYGHYVNYNISGYYWRGSLDEGFADFYSFAVRNYAQARYGEKLFYAHVLEAMPFYTPRWTDNSKHPAMLDPMVDSDKYVINYAVKGAFLWNIYDKYIDPGFKGEWFGDFNNADNDDVGESLLIFQKLAYPNGYTTVDSFLTLLKSAVSIEEAASMQKIYDCIIGDGSGNSTTQMRPAQIKDLTKTETTTYSSPGHILTSVTVNLDWLTQYYGSDSRWLNPASGIHVYEAVAAGDWVLLDDGTLSASATHYQKTSYTFSANKYLAYKVTTYDAAGDAHDGPVVEIDAVASMKLAPDNWNPTAAAACNLSTGSNPFTDHADIELDISNGANGNIEVFDLLGRRVANQPFEQLSAGKVKYTFDASLYAPQTYICRAKVRFADGTYKEQTISLLNIR